jgi:hypothetical protein
MLAWILAIITLAAPPGRFPARESEADARARYALIATAADNAARAAPLFAGPEGHRRTVALLLAVAVHESGLRVDVDRGELRGDGGQSWCLMQVHVGDGKTPEGWTGPELAADHAKCFIAGAHLLRRSLVACRESPPDDRLAAYASGSCARGLPESRVIIGMARRWLDRN